MDAREVGLRRLGAAVALRRRQLGLSKEAAARAVRMSSITWKRVEDGLSVRDTSYAAIERALNWPDGEVDRIRAGQDSAHGITPPEPPRTLAGLIAYVEGLTDLSRRDKRILLAQIEAMRSEDVER